VQHPAAQTPERQQGSEILPRSPEKAGDRTPPVEYFLRSPLQRHRHMSTSSHSSSDKSFSSTSSDQRPQPLSGLQGQAVLITGAAKRIGAGIARCLHAEGAHILIHFRQSATAAEKLCEELNSSRPNSAACVPGDLLNTAALPALVQTAAKVFGRLDILINNASTFYPTPLGSIQNSQWDDLIGTNLKAPLFLAQAARPWLKQTRGLILNMVDIHAQRPLPDHPVYCVAKAGLVMLTRSLARELGPEIRVNGIAPGPILWPAGEMDESLKQEIVSKTALQRMGSPEDIAKAALFFAKDAPYVTGQILGVDGGRSLGW
jgi:pteridine reductase